MSGRSGHENLRILGKGLLLIAALAGLGFALKASGLQDMFDTEWVDTRVRGRGLTGEALFLAAGALFTAAGLPRQVIAFLGGYAFGFLTGTLLALVATLAGCAIAFSVARLMGRRLLTKWKAHGGSGENPIVTRIRRMDAFLRQNPLSMSMLVRLPPVGSNLVTNLTAGFSSVPMIPFLAGSAVGMLPQTAVFTLVGSGVNLDPGFRIGLGAALFVASTLVGIALYRKYRRGRSFDPRVEEALGEEAGASQAR